MTLSKVFNLVAAVLGMLGALILYKGSFAYESPGAYMDNAMVDAMRSRNTRRLFAQRLGLGLISASFALQIAALLLE
ncbi:hypothetical protein [Methylocapsa palsarum]|uniref:Uncharacterized protein n=1 Tax=Methylocapsa palsarum TaxID=1612308 RepID=A0A1I4CFH5_9HYPH|nr:hypothetical protein [Methylocapsa palsarum]SFK78906.1 hypothetical protein SAMN05444581_1212 [Methylocapsa palsarum]